jgi:uncharacterized membrane protein YjfL (UPF0719 family)
MNVLTTKYNLPGFGDYALAALKIVIVVAFLVLLWVLIDKVTSFDDERELFQRRNMAYAVVRISIVAAQTIALLPLIGTVSGNFWSDIGPLLAWGAGVSVVLLALNWVFDAAIHRRGGMDALSTGTMADAITKGGFYLASGLIFNAALSGTAPSLGQAIAASIVFSALGFVALLAGYALLGLIGPFRRRQQLGADNLAASIISAGVVVGLGFLLRLAIAGDFTGWTAGLLGFMVTFILGYLLLVVLIFAIDVVVVRSKNLREIVGQNEVPAACVMAGMLIAVGLTIGSVAL